MGMLFGRQNARVRQKLVAGQLPAHRAGRHLDLWIVANALHFAHRADSHHVKLIAILSEPDGRGDFLPVFANCRQGDVFLAVDCRRDCAGHADIVAAVIGTWLSRVVRPDPEPIDPALSSVLKALHA